MHIYIYIYIYTYIHIYTTIYIYIYIYIYNVSRYVGHEYVHLARRVTIYVSLSIIYIYIYIYQRVALGTDSARGRISPLGLPLERSCRAPLQSAPAKRVLSPTGA